MVETADSYAEDPAGGVSSKEGPISLELTTEKQLTTGATGEMPTVVEQGEPADEVLVLPPVTINNKPQMEEVSGCGAMAVERTGQISFPKVSAEKDDNELLINAAVLEIIERGEQSPDISAALRDTAENTEMTAQESPRELPESVHAPIPNNIGTDATRHEEPEGKKYPYTGRLIQEAIGEGDGSEHVVIRDEVEPKERSSEAPAMTYIPVVTGETSELRGKVESLFDGSDRSAVMRRIKELDQATEASGRKVTFGMEVEYEFVPDPTSAVEEGELDKEDLYEQVVTELQGGLGIISWSKGAVLWPDETSQPVMVNQYTNIDTNTDTFNPDQVGTDISENRTTPAGAVEALKRYWRTIDAIGIVAARNGLLGMILSTHVNTSVITTEYFDEGGKIERLPEFMDERSDAELVAAIQHNRNLLRPFQLDAGLAQGVVVSEAFPNSKDVSTVIYPHRLEFRHPIVGVVDPRIDMLASLAAVEQAVTATIPSAALEELKECQSLYFLGMPDKVAQSLSDIIFLDYKTDRFVMPSEVLPSARNQTVSYILDDFVRDITRGKVSSYEAQGGQVLRKIVDSMKLVGEHIIADPQSEYKTQLDEFFRQCRVIVGTHCYRIEPEVTYEDPESHIQSREETLMSDPVRTLLGAAIAGVVPSSVAVSQRQTVIDAHMIQAPTSEDG
jgi:hypothetical protein